jgi:hypothetical protein
MRRLRGTLFTLASGLSLLLFVGISGMWVRSYWHKDAYIYRWHQQLWELASDKGRVWVDNDPQLQSEQRTIRSEVQAHLDQYKRLGDRFDRDRQTPKQPWIDGASARGNPDAYNDFVTSENARYSLLKKQQKELDSVHQIARRPMTPLAAHSILYELPALLTAALPLMWFASWRRACSWRRNGFCARCGYDLRASPDRCLECGESAAPI